MKKSDRHQLSAVIHHFLYRTYELPLSWYGMTVSGLSQADITCLHGTCRTVLFAADRLMIAGDLPVLDARPFNDRVVHFFHVLIPFLYKDLHFSQLTALISLQMMLLLCNDSLSVGLP